MIKNNYYLRMRHAEHLKPITRRRITVTVGTFRATGYLQAVTEEYTIDRILGKIHVKHVK